MEQLQTIPQTGYRECPQILILEDETSVANGLQMVLNEGGYSADLEFTGRDALNAFKQKEHDLLIADLRLPDIDGMEVIKQVKHEHPETGVIVITGYSTVPSVVEAMKLGAYDYLPKPFTEDEIMSAVQSALTNIKEAELPPPELRKEALPHKLHLMVEDQTRVDAVMAEIKEKFAGKPDAVIPMLQTVQDHIGYLPENALEAIASLTRRSKASIFGAATFYEQFRLKPIGKHVVKVCRGTACHVRGAQRILEEAKRQLGVEEGQTTEDLEYTLETVACIGCCALGPVHHDK